MTRNPAMSAVTSLPRSVLSSLLTSAALMAIITGILAMHVWMGGHGSTSHHLAAPTTTNNSSAHPAAEPGYGQDASQHQAIPEVLPAVTAINAAATDASSTVPGALCGGDCADEMMLGMCVLAMIVVGVAGLLSLVVRGLLSTQGWRGPPSLSWASRPAPTPSLTQLCISRT